MSAATRDRNTLSRAGSLLSIGVEAGEVIYGGTLVTIDSDGYAQPATNHASRTFAGVAVQGKDNSDGADDAISVELYRQGVFRFGAASLSTDDVGLPVYVIDDQTVGLINHASTNNHVYVGTIEEVESATVCWVRIDTERKANEPRGIRQWTFEIAGVNATAFSFTSLAASFGGSAFYITEVLAVRATVISTGAAAAVNRKVITTHWTLSGGVLSAVGDETLNSWVVTFNGYLVP